MEKLATLVRNNAGRSSIKANYRDEISQRGKMLDEYYTHDILKFDVEKSEVKQERPVVWANAESILNEVVERRSLVGYYKVKVLADGGQNFFKISMSIIPENYVSDFFKEGEEGPTAK